MQCNPALVIECEENEKIQLSLNLHVFHFHICCDCVLLSKGRGRLWYLVECLLEHVIFPCMCGFCGVFLFFLEGVAGYWCLRGMYFIKYDQMSTDKII